MVPRHAGPGGKTQQLSLSKRGDTYLRTLLIAGARAMVVRSGKSDWIERLLQRRHYNLMVVALANKMARTAWAVLAWGMAFDRRRWNSLAAVRYATCPQHDEQPGCKATNPSNHHEAEACSPWVEHVGDSSSPCARSSCWSTLFTDKS